MVLRLDTLPEGIVDDILDIIQLSESHGDARKDFYSLCLVSRAFLQPARRSLYRHIELEYSSLKPTVQQFKRAILQEKHVAVLVRSLKISTALGNSNKSQGCQTLALLLAQICERCPRLEDIHFTPDDHARNFESLFVKAWKSSASLKSFTLVMAQFRDLVLIPQQEIESLTLEHAREGDFLWEYDLLHRSWPNRSPMQVQELRLVRMAFPAYNDHTLIPKLEHITRAVACPQSLVLVSCTLSHHALEVLLGISGESGWSNSTLENLVFESTYIVDDCDKATLSYSLPYLPGLKSVTIKRQVARVVPDPNNRDVEIIYSK